MPLISASIRPLEPGNRPEWCTASSAGFFVMKGDTIMDCHYHDFPEYWFFAAGKGKVVSEGVEYYVKAGDIICTRAGDEHDILEIYEDLVGFWFEEACPPGGRTGHLHYSAQKAAGHRLARAPLPPDFPV